MNELITIKLSRNEATFTECSLTVVGGDKPNVKFKCENYYIDKNKQTRTLTHSSEDTYDIKIETYNLIKKIIDDNEKNIKPLKKRCDDGSTSRWINYRIDYNGRFYLGYEYPLLPNKDNLPSMLYASINDILQRNEAIEFNALGYFNFRKQIDVVDFNEVIKYYHGRYMTNKKDKNGCIHTTCPICNSTANTFEYNTINHTYKCNRCGSYGNVRSFIRDWYHMDAYRTTLVNSFIERFLPIDYVHTLPTKTEFDELILKSVNTSSHLIKDTNYFDEEYANALGKYLGHEGEKLMNEFTDLGKGRIKICSVASSARLCALYFAKREFSYPKPAGEFEKCFPIKSITGIPPHIDYYSIDTNTCYECKCREILDDHSNDKLKIKYKKMLEPLLMNPHFECDEQFIYPTLKDLGMIKTDLLEKLHLTADASIYKLHFNVKQLLTHLMGLLSNENSVTDKLQYIFFTPSYDYLHGPNSYKARALYDILKAEIELIKSSYTIRYAEKHGVVFLNPIFIDVSTIYDHALALTRDEDYSHQSNRFEDLFNKYVNLGYIPTVESIAYDNKVSPNFAFRLQYNLLLYRSKEYKFRLAFPVVIKPEIILTDSKVHHHTDIVEQSFCDHYQICSPIAKNVYNKFIELRNNKEIYETK